MSETLHVLSLPHTQTTSEYATCAYTQRAIKFCRMMTGGERKVILYSGEHNEAPCDEHVVVVTDEQQERWFGKHDLDSLDRGGMDWNPYSPWWSETNARTIGEIQKRSANEDILCLLMGQSQQIIADALPSLIVAEYAVGYKGVLEHRPPGASPYFAAFESNSHRHLVYGYFGWENSVRQYDTVIPNQFDPAEFPYTNAGNGDYLLFLGRLIRMKAPGTACLIADALDMPVKIAGPGATKWGDTFVEFPEGRIEAEQLEYVGPVTIDERAELLAGAAATIVPTIYAEPFGGVAVESMMAGTPVVATDFGAFTETVREGVSGYRFQTLLEAVDATRSAMLLDPLRVRRYAEEHYSLSAVTPQYERWLGNLDGLWGVGWSYLPERAPA